MKKGGKSLITLGLSIFLYSEAVAETMPRILTNFPVSQDDTVKKAFSERVRASFPKDIRTSTLTALLEMDGFTVVNAGDRYAANFVETEFPCITNYTLSWSENDRGHVAGIQVAMSHKCV